MTDTEADTTIEQPKPDAVGAEGATAGQEVADTAPQQQFVTEMGHEAAPLVPKDTAELMSLAGAICKSGAVPKSYTSGGQPNRSLIAMGILRGMEVGFYPLTALQWIMPVNGRFSVWGDGAIAIIQRKRALEKQTEHWETEGGKNIWEKPPVAGLARDKIPNDLTCVVRLKRTGGQWWEGRFSVQDAKTAKLWGDEKRDPWQKYPIRMLFNRARAFAIRDGFSDHLNGLYIREEAEDMPPLVTAEPSPGAAALTGSVSATSGMEIENEPHRPDGKTETGPEPVADAGGDSGGGDAGPDDGGAGSGDRDLGATVETAPPEDEVKVERELLKQLLNCESAGSVDALVAAYAIALDRWRLDDTERYQRVVEQIRGKREAIGSRGR